MRRVVAIVLGLALLATSGCSVIGGKDTYSITAYFSRAVSVFRSSDVKILGLPAGNVSKIEVIGDRVRIDMEINSDVPVPADVRAMIVPQSLIGERYIQLSPAWTEGKARAKDGHVIDLEHTIVPVEPDEALEALREFLDSLDPEGLGRLINNASDALAGNGATLNQALDNFSGLITTLAEKDDELVSIVENFDRFTATLATRESQLGEVLDAFAGTTQVLADERAALGRLLAGLADVSEAGLDLLAEHSTRLRTDIATVTRLARSIGVNLDSLGALLDGGPLLADGLRNAYNPTLRAMNLRTQFGPLAQSILNPVLRGILGDPTFSLPCVPVDTTCEDVLGGLAAEKATAVRADLAPTRTPIDDVLALLAAPSATDGSADRGGARSLASRLAGGLGATGRFLRGAAGTFLGVGR